MSDKITQIEEPGFEEFFKHYLGAAIWTGHDTSQPETVSGDANLDAYSIYDFAPTALATQEAEALAFFTANKADFDIQRDGQSYERAGYHFWMTRTHQGVGYWDGDWDKDIGERLTNAAHAYRDLTVYVGDDGKLWFE